IYVYLSSGVIKGIGEKMAKRIIEKFGVDTLDIIQNSPHRLSEVEGIGSKKIEQIAKSYEENRELRNIIMHLSPYGITPNFCLKIYKRYKNKAIDIITKKPYKLAEDIRGVGFKVADNIASNLGIDKFSKDRIMQGILYTLNQSLGSGHTYLPKDILIDEASKLLGVDNEYISDSILSLAYDQKIHIERNFGDEEHIY
ncbi:ATP-dependent RecD-like DNA helicase, partial [Burkholderia pseudomallei]